MIATYLLIIVLSAISTSTYIQYTYIIIYNIYVDEAKEKKYFLMFFQIKILILEYSLKD